MLYADAQPVAVAFDQDLADAIAVALAFGQDVAFTVADPLRGDVVEVTAS